MFFLSNIFRLRDKINPEAEKPFLEHLEDLRVTITKILVTLIITTLVCFSYHDRLMDILRRPITEVWQIHSANRLPQKSEITAEAWEQAKLHADALASLPEISREVYRRTMTESEADLASVATHYRSTQTIPNAEKRNAYIDQLTHLSEHQRALLKELVVLKPDTASGARDRFKFMSSLDPTESFMLSIKLSLFGGVVLAFPLLMWFLLQFILPGLHQHEKKAIFPALAIGFGLFLCGSLFAYLWVLPNVLEFFYSYGEDMGISNDWRIGYYLSFATQFTLIFGVCFELPVIVWVLVKIGLLNYELMSKTRSYAIIAILVIAAVITPTPDAFTLCLLAVPMIILYEISIWLAWWDAHQQKKRELEEENARIHRLSHTPLDEPPTPTSHSHAIELGPNGSPSINQQSPDAQQSAEDSSPYIDWHDTEPGEHKADPPVTDPSDTKPAQDSTDQDPPAR